MVAEPRGSMATSSFSANGAPIVAITHEGIANVAITQDSINQLMECAQTIETASANVNEGTGIEAIKTIMRTLALVICIHRHSKHHSHCAW